MEDLVVENSVLDEGCDDRCPVEDVKHEAWQLI